MIKKGYVFAAALVATLSGTMLLGGCSAGDVTGDVPGGEGFGGSSDGGGRGMLDLASIAPSVVEVSAASSAVGASAVGASAATRAVGDRTSATRAQATDDFTVKVWRLVASGEIAVGSWTAAECAEPVELLEGRYRMEVSSPERTLPAWDAPTWRGSVDSFTIEPDETTEIGAVECAVDNIKVTVRYSDGVRESVDEGSVLVTVTVGGKSLEYPWGEGRGGWFAAGEGGVADMTVEFSGTVGGDEIVQSRVIENVAAGEWERVFVALDTDGDIFRITVFGSEAGQLGEGNDWI